MNSKLSHAIRTRRIPRICVQYYKTQIYIELLRLSSPSGPLALHDFGKSWRDSSWTLQAIVPPSCLFSNIAA